MMGKRHATVLALMLLLLPGWSPHAADHGALTVPLTTVDAGETSLMVHDHLHHACAPPEQAPPELILREPGSIEWTPASSGVPNLGFTRKVCWFHARLAPEADRDWLLFPGYALLDRLDIYLMDSDGRVLGQFRSGLRRPAPVDAVAGYREAFPLRTGDDGEAQLFMRAESAYGMQLPVQMISRDAFEGKRQLAMLLHGLFLGGMLVAFLYSLFLHFSLREPAYLLHALWIVCVTLFVVLYEDLAGAFFPGARPLLSAHAMSWLLPLLSIVPALFALRFLALHERAPGIARVLRIQILLAAPLLPALVFLDRYWIVPPATAMILLVNLSVLWAGIVQSRRGDAYAYAFTIAWVAYIAGSLILGLNKFGVLPYNLITEYLVQVGVFVSVILHSLSFSHRIHYLQDAHNRSVQERARAEMEAFRASARNQAKSDFLATMSHEIRTPLHGMLGMTELLRGTTLDNRQNRYVETIMDSSRSLLAVINDLLDYSRIENGNLTLDNRETETEALVDESIALFAQRAAQKGLPLYSFIESRVPARVRTDPVRTKQILTNLLSNAIKYTERGEIALHVALREPPDETGRCIMLFEVSDTGPGLADERHRAIFRAFSHNDQGAGQIPASGLGLSISRQLAEMMGGEMGVTSSPGRGSTFSFTIACTVVDGDPRQPELTGQRAVLISADNRLRLSLSQLLARWGMDVREAMDAADAERQLELIRASDAGTAVVFWHQREPDGQARLPEACDDCPLILVQDFHIAGPPSALPDTSALELPVQPARLRQLLLDTIRAHGGMGELNPLLDDPVPEEFAGLRVFVAEDNHINRFVMESMLRDMGLDPVVTTNGRELLARYHESGSTGKPDVIIMDCEMPGMDGYEATRKLRETEHHQGEHVWIIAVSAHAGSDYVQKAHDAGVDDYLSKPVSRARLIKALRRFHRMKHSQAGHDRP